MTANELAVITSGLSALSWGASIIVTPIITATYWDGPPKHLVRRMKAGALLNMGGALFAAVTMGLQAYSLA